MGAVYILAIFNRGQYSGCHCIIVAIRSQNTKVGRGHHIGGLIDIYIKLPITYL